MSKAQVENLLIPVPPLPIQEEIVRILDKFTALTTELTAELAARKLQYKTYREQVFGLLVSKDNDSSGTIQVNENNPLRNGKLAQMVRKMCPDGVEYKRVGDVTEYEQPTAYIVGDTKYKDTYQTPVLTAGQTFILGYTNETNGIYNASAQSPVIIFDDFTASLKWVDFPFKVKSSAMKMVTAKNDVLIRYLYHWMMSVGYSSNEHTRLWISEYSDFLIPVPPLPVQEEIIRILDKFDALCNSLTSGIPAEIAARQKQYEYYRDKLLSFQ